MKIVSWNVNSIKARGDHVARFLEESAPDVLMVQELKGLEFPAERFEALGYHTHAVCQKAYNGVAVFSKTPITVIAEALPGDDSDEQARFIDFETNDMRLINIYLPNGNPVFSSHLPRHSGESRNPEDLKQPDPRLRGDDAGGEGDPCLHEKFTYKLNWMARLYNYLADLRGRNIPFAIGGDFNVIPQDKDCHAPKAWAGDALFRPQSWNKFRTLENLGLYDAFRIYNNGGGHYTFWDYQGGAWQNDKGIRIDHFLLSPELADRLTNCTIDTAPRGWDKPSDHTPIIVEIAA